MENKISLISKDGFYCELNKKYYSTLRGMLNYLRTHNMSSEDYYIKYLGDVGKCLKCNKDTHFIRITEGYRTYCSVTCLCKSKEHRLSISKRFEGQDEKRKQAIDKCRDTKSKWSDEFKNQLTEKRLNTLIGKYGENYFSEKTKKQWERRSEDQIKILVDKSNQTKIKNGTYSPNPYKNTFRDFKCGEFNFRVQGYEDITIGLLSKLIDLSEIKTGNKVPRIFLTEHKNYYPDILYRNLLIEVKSEYTYYHFLDENNAKYSSSIAQGFGHIFFIIHSKDVLKNRTLKNEETYLSILRKAISSQASFDEEGSTTIP